VTCKCAKRIAKLERDVTRLRAQLPREIHHAVRTELTVEMSRREPPDAHGAPPLAWTFTPIHKPLGPQLNREVRAALHNIGSDSYSFGTWEE
jgi:hypothetical protein